MLYNAFHVLNPFEPAHRDAKYWTSRTTEDLLQEADRLHEQERHLEIYEILNRIRYRGSIEAQWRVARALFKMSCEPATAPTVRAHMIREAYELITHALSLDDSHAEVHKWTAIILGEKSSQESALAKVRSLAKVKEHMLKSVELNPADPHVYYLLGNLCYEMTNLSWVQRLISRLFFLEPPSSSYDEAYGYFQRAEQIRPRFFVGNIYMLGKCCFEMGMMYKARYYLKMAADLPVFNDFEREQSEHAKKLADQLKDFDLVPDALIES